MESNIINVVEIEIVSILIIIDVNNIWVTGFKHGNL